ncbi:MAG TPA: sulfurtransferase TusA family protein [Candidatus Limnocylindrales bacterium]|nr:sulfurtransferase TusA family protein [Candidatus Limnocylindrales bacterium]
MQLKLDCLGDMCPIPILKAQEALKKLVKGDSLLLVTDHNCVARSLVEKLSKQKHQIEENEVMNGIWEITVTKN